MCTQADANNAIAIFTTQVNALVTVPPASGASPNGTYAPPAMQLLDPQGGVWSLGSVSGVYGSQVLKNNQPYNGGWADTLAISGINIFAKNHLNNCYKCTFNGGWQQIDPTQMPPKTN